MPQTQSEIRAWLARRGMSPRKRFGQNFLVDANKLQQIIAAAEVGPGDLVLEVGAGTGALTEGLLEAGARVVAVEIDRDLAAILRERFGEHERFTLVEGDVLAGKRGINPAVVEALARERRSDEATKRRSEEDASVHRRDIDAEGISGKVGDRSPSSLRRSVAPSLPAFHLIANLPYNIASPLLATLAMDHPAMRRAVVMVQREVADRLTAKPGGKDYGPLTVVVQATCAVERVMTLPPGCFWPPPKVHSAVIRMTRRAEPLTDDPAGLAAFAQRLFQQRRKQIGSILGRDVDWPEGVCAEMRPEQLGLEQLIALRRRVEQP
jgi:16S rRNA (adenine1518-N6/adenine1519-N6)-dimethyltransferase